MNQNRLRVVCPKIFVYSFVLLIFCFTGTFAQQAENKQLIAPAQEAKAIEFYNLGCKCASDDTACQVMNFTKAIEIYPDFVEALNNRGLAFYFQRKYEFAEKDFNRSIELAPEFTNAFYNRAVLYADRDQ